MIPLLRKITVAVIAIGLDVGPLDERLTLLMLIGVVRTLVHPIAQSEENDGRQEHLSRFSLRNPETSLGRFECN